MPVRNVSYYLVMSVYLDRMTWYNDNTVRGPRFICTVRLLEALHHIRGASFYVRILSFVRQDPSKNGTIYGTINALNNKCFY